MPNHYANQDALEHVCKHNTVRSYLEIGTWKGDSLRVVLKNTPKLERLVVCDLWDGTYEHTRFKDHAHIAAILSEYRYRGQIIWLDGSSHEQIPAFRSTDPEVFDLIHVDGDHSFEGARADLEDCWPLLRNGGHLVFDDILYGRDAWVEKGKLWLLCVFEEFIDAHTDAAILKIEQEKPDGYGLVKKVLR
jgi:predicted O-methyltransferase YrrM